MTVPWSVPAGAFLFFGALAGYVVEPPWSLLAGGFSALLTWCLFKRHDEADEREGVR